MDITKLTGFTPEVDSSNREVVRLQSGEWSALLTLAKLGLELASEAEDVANLFRAYLHTPQAFDATILTERAYLLEQKARALRGVAKGEL